MVNIWQTVQPMLVMLNKVWVTLWDYIPELLPYALGAVTVLFAVRVLKGLFE